MNVNQCVGWILVLGSVVLLVTQGKLDLLVILLPLAVLLALGIGCSEHHDAGLTSGVQKG
jgi:hypothetical protein